MKIVISADSLLGIASELPGWVREHGHEVVLWGALRPGADSAWATCSASAAEEIAAGRADQAVICCTTGTGASIAANKVPGVRAALCVDAFTAAGARRYNDANVLCISLRLTSATVMQEMLQAWYDAEIDPGQAASIAHVKRLDQAAT